MRRPRAARWHHTRCRWPTCPSNQRRRAPFGSRCRSPQREGPRSRRNAPYVRTSTTPAGQCWNTWRGTRCTLRPRQTTRRRPPKSCRGEHGGPHGTPRTPCAPRPRQPTTQMEMRRHPERPRGPAVRPHQGPCPSPLAALKICTDGGGLTLINVHGPQAGCSPWAGRAAFWADIQMYATARSLGGRHPVVIAGDTNIYMDVPANPATEHF